MSRYLKREKAINDKEQYDKLFEKRGVKQVVQYRSPKAKHVTDEQLARVECSEYVWAFGDSYEKLAQKFYGNPSHWWVIASFNRKPTESHVNMGDKLRIPVSLADALRVVE
jgi:nucleoid-associated protein YgaU